MALGPGEAVAAKAAIAIIQIAHKQGMFDRLLDVFKEKHKVLVLGTTGVGKSNFIKSLESLIPETIDRMQRTAEAKERRVRLGRRIFDLSDTPGDPARFGHRDDAITEARSRLIPFGLVHVVSWGFHEYRTGHAEAVEHGRASAKWLDDHRKIEIDRMLEWAPRLGGRPAYTITLVSKADLWWGSHDEVLSHYAEEGSYWQAIRAVASRGHVVLPYSSVTHPFYGMAPTAGLFSSEDRQRCQQALLQELFLSVTRIQSARDDQR